MTPLLRHRILSFAALAELGIGLVLVVEPSVIVRLLLGEPIVGLAAVLGRCFGVALVALGIACWPQASSDSSSAMPRLGMAVYNALVTLYLGYLGVVSHMNGILLWPTALLHAGVALLLLWPCRGERDTQATPH
jgi:O-antigen ligase